MGKANERCVTLSVPVRLIPALEYLLDHGRVAAESADLAPLIFDRSQSVRELIEKQINHAMSDPKR